MDEELAVGVRVNTDAVEKMSAAAATTTAATTKMQSGFSSLTTAAQKTTSAQELLNEAVQQLGPAAAAGSAQAQTIIAAYQAQAVAAEAVAVSTNEATVATEKLTVASGHTVSQMAAASGAVREFGGALPIRAVENFLTKTLGLGPALQAIFPVVGGLAFLGVLVQLGDKALDLYDDLVGVKQLQIDVAEGIAKGAEKIATSGAHAAATIHQMGMRDNPLGTLQNDITNTANSLQYLQAKAAAAKKDLHGFETIKSSGNYYGHDTDEETNDADIQSHKAKIEEINSQIKDTKATLDDLQSQEADKQKQIDKKNDKSGDSAARKAAEAQMQGFESQLAIMQTFGPLTLEMERSFWEDKIAATTKGSANYLAIQRRIGQESQEIFRQQAAAEKANEKIEDKPIQQKPVEVNNESGRQAVQQVRAMQQQSAAMRAGADAQEEYAIKSRDASGFLGQLTQAQDLAALHTKEYNAELERLKANLAAINNNSSLSGNEKAAEAAKQNADIAKLEASRGTQKMQDQSGIEAPYKKAAMAIRSDFTTTFDSILHGQKVVVQGIGLMFGQMLTQGANALLNLGMKYVEHYALVDLLHVQSETVKTTATITAQATQAATTATTNLASVVSYSGVGGAAATASTAAIPFVGAALAPAAGAATAAEIMAFAPIASAAGGWDVVPKDGTITELHKEEMVLSSPLANKIRNMTNPGSSITNHFGNNTFNGSAGDFPQMLDDHEDSLAAKIVSLHRDGRLG